MVGGQIPGIRAGFFAIVLFVGRWEDDGLDAFRAKRGTELVEVLPMLFLPVVDAACNRCVEAQSVRADSGLSIKFASSRFVTREQLETDAFFYRLVPGRRAAPGANSALRESEEALNFVNDFFRAQAPFYLGEASVRPSEIPQSECRRP